MQWVVPLRARRRDTGVDRALLKSVHGHHRQRNLNLGGARGRLSVARTSLSPFPVLGAWRVLIALAHGNVAREVCDMAALSIRRTLQDP